MYQPNLYTKSNKIQRESSKKVVDMYFDYIQFRSDGKDSLLDVGCGPGDFLMDIIYPKLPKSYSKVVGIDISPSMVQYAGQIYSKNKSVDFKVLDIATPNLPIEFCEQFDHVVSFYCLNWVQNQKQALRNIYDMMVKNGDFLLTFPCSSPMYEVWKIMSINLKWKEYMEDVDTFIPFLQNNSDPRMLWYTEVFKELGFADIKIDLHERSYLYEGSTFGDFLISINPFVERVPNNKRSEFRIDLLECWANIGLCERNPETNDNIYKFSYKRVIACGRK